MKSLTPFQEALLASTEAQFADVPAEDQVEIQPSPEFYNSRPGKKKSRKPLRKAILIAAAVALFAGIAFAAHYFTLGKVDVTAGILKCPLTAEEVTDGAYVVDIKFREDFSDSNAPDIIETYYLPTLDICKNADYKDYEIGDEKSRYLPLRSKEEIDELNRWAESDNTSDLSEDTEGIVYFGDFTDQMPEAPEYFHADWFADDQQISFSQKPAKSIPDIDVFSIFYEPDCLPETKTEMLQIGNYEVLSISIEWQFPWEGETDRHTTHHWYWTDGAYLFELSVNDTGTTVCDTDRSFMQQLMESVQPVDDPFTEIMQSTEDTTEHFGE